MFRTMGFTASMVISSGRARCGRVDGLHVELDVDAVPDEHAARLEDLVPLEAEILALDRRLRDEADALVAPRVLAAAGGLGVEHDLAGDVADRQRAGDAEVAAGVL